MKRTSIHTLGSLAPGLALVLAATPALAQISPTLAPIQSPVSGAIAAATEVREAAVREVYGVDNASGCDLLLPAGEASPVLFRRASAGTARMEIFTGDTGLVLVGRDLALLRSATLRIAGGAAISGTIMRRRLAGSQCGETAGNGAGVAVLRFAIPALTAATSATITMRTRRQYPPSAFALTPCDPKAIGAALEGGLERFAHCFPDTEFDVASIPVTLVPRPRITSLTAGSETDGAGSFRIVNGQIPLLGALIGTGLARMNALRREDLPGSAPGMSAHSFTLGSARPTFMLTWFNPVAGQTASGKVRGSVPMLRFPRNSGGGINAARNFVDTAWAGGAADGLRSMGEGRYAITALAATGGTTGGGTTTPPATTITIKAFDPGNILFNAGGGTTTVENTGVSATMTGLASESWCATVPQPAFGPGGTRVVAQGIANLPAIRWGVRNEGTTAFNGSITAELRLRGRVVDTLTFTGALPAGGTQVKSFARLTSQVTVARESLGPKCFYVGNPSDPVLENSAYDVKVITPAAHTKTLVSLP